MILELTLALLFGVLFGTFTGLIPGIHINLISAILLSLPFLSIIPPFTLAVFIVAMAITHTYTDFIPSTFLGAPNEDTSLGVLPGHKFLLKGRGHYALKLTVVGSLIGTASLLIVVPLLWFGLPVIYSFMQQMMAFFLIWIVILLLLGANMQWKASLFIFLVSGIFGYTALSFDLKEPLLPLLTGLFGSSSIIYSIKSKIKVPRQKLDPIPIMKEDVVKPTLATVLVSPISSVFPGLGSSQAAVMGSQIVKRITKEQFLVLLGSINTLVMATSFLALFLLQRTRTGAAAAIEQLLTLSKTQLFILLALIVLTSLIAAVIALFLSKKLATNIHRVNYAKISIVTLALLTYVVFWFSGPLGIFIFATGTYIGLTCIRLGVQRSFLMGALLIPTIIFYLPF